MKITHEITLDVSRQGVQASIPITQHDSGIHSLLIHLRNGSKEIKLDDSLTATLYLSNDSYENVTIYTENSAYPNCLECYVTPNMTSETGEYTAQLQIFQGADRLISAPEFLLMVKVDRSANSTVLSSSPFAAVVSARDAAEASAQVAESAMFRAEQAADNASATATEVATSVATEIATEKATEMSKLVVGELASNALKGKVKNWNGTGILLDDVSPLGEVTVTSNFIDEMTVTSCGKNVVKYCDVNFPLNLPSDMESTRYPDDISDYSVFRGNLSAENIYIRFDKGFTSVNNGASAYIRIYYTGAMTRNVGQYYVETTINNNSDAPLVVTPNGVTLFHLQGTLEQIDVTNWAGITGNLKICVYIGNPLPSGQINKDRFTTLFDTYEPYVEGETVFIEGHGIGKLKPISPNMTLYSDVPDGEYSIDYNKDINVVINKLTNAIIATGGNV